MALSQIQCLDDNHVNPRTNESKPDFLYSEDQRLALEALLREGRQSFVKFLEERHMRGFLSDLEQETLTGTLEPYDPGSELFPEDAEENQPPLSLHYWPDLSDLSVPQMDLGWPHTEAYRGVTRTSVYTQPPLEGQTHIKEIVRKMIAQAQKVIAVVMDVFTDVDIFRDLIDAGYKRKVSIYILVESTTLPHFLSMCHRANMHAGHLKHLRVRCTEGSEFYTRSCTKVRGRLGHRFMFIDGDKAVSGSFSFTWMSSRLDKNLVTVVTGQAVEAFDHLFRHLYTTSRFVDLRQVSINPEPEPEPVQQPVPVVLPSTTLARKLYNPKYALLIGDNASTPPPAAENSPKESQTPEVPDSKKRRRGRGSPEPAEELIHPGLVNLEKACLISYLPTWPEPDPPSDVIGFINIMDTSKPTQVHLQRSERFETSQAIRFSSPFSMPKEILPEVARPRESTFRTEKTNPPIKAEEPVHDPPGTKAENLQIGSFPSGALTRQGDGQPRTNTTSQSSNHEHTKHTAKYRTYGVESNKTEVSQSENRDDSNPAADHKQTKTATTLRQADRTEQGSTSSTNNPHSASVSSTSFSDNNPIPATTSMAADAPLSVNSSSFARPTLTSRFETVQSHLSSSSSSNTQNPAPRTVHSVTKNGDTSNGPSMVNTSTPKRPDSLTTKKPDGSKSSEESQQQIAGMWEKSNRDIGILKYDNKPDKEAVGRPDGKAGTSHVSDEVNTTDHDGDTKPRADHGAAGETSRAPAKPIPGSKSANIQNENHSENKSYHVKENKPQRISYSERPTLSMWERIQAQTLEPSSTDDTPPKLPDDVSNPEKNIIRRASQEPSLPVAPEEPPNLHLPDIPSLEREPRSTLESPTKTQDFRNSTSDMSDGYLSSNRSTTSEEYYECSGSPKQERVFDSDNTHANTPQAANTSPLVVDYSPYAALFGTKDKNTTSHETLDKNVKMKDKDVTNKDMAIKKMDGKGEKLRSERDSKGKEKRNGEESKTAGVPMTVAKGKDAQAQTPVRKRALNPSTTETPVHKVLSRAQRAGPSDGSGRQVDGPKQPKSTSKSSRPASATQGERKVFHNTSQVLEYLASFRKTSLGRPPS
uniref:protein FAM83G-like n=1 Tax=Doryrhamphus excisus TaxID=161450 RepID=UPI0025AE9F42|nr:protein FAM83G-like [Doryrhamphus excisus]